MLQKWTRPFRGGNIVIWDVPSVEGSSISVVDAILLNEYAGFLNGTAIFGLIEVRYDEIKEKFYNY